MKVILAHIIFILMYCLVLPANAQRFGLKQTVSPLEYYVLNDLDAAWNTNPIHVYLAPEKGLNGTGIIEIENRLNSFILEAKKWQEKKKETAFLAYLFKKTHKEFLKTYTPLSTFAQTINTGEYDCLTGTMLFAHILGKLDIEYTIYETNLHVYLKVKTSKDKDILIESTDPYNGFEKSRSRIAKREHNYKVKAINAIRLQNRQDNNYQDYKLIFTPITLKALAGLQYYNKAVKAFNEDEYQVAKLNLDKTDLFYHSNRMVALGQLIISHSTTEEVNAVLQNSSITLK